MLCSEFFFLHVWERLINAYHDKGKTFGDLCLIALCPFANSLNCHHRSRVFTALWFEDYFRLVTLLELSLCLALHLHRVRDVRTGEMLLMTKLYLIVVGLSHLFYEVFFLTIYLFKHNLLFSEPSKPICLREMSHGNLLWLSVLCWRTSLRELFFLLLLFVLRLSFKFLKYLCSTVGAPFIAVKYWPRLSGWLKKNKITHKSTVLICIRCLYCLARFELMRRSLNIL